jgi:hypothetical protein
MVRYFSKFIPLLACLTLLLALSCNTHTEPTAPVMYQTGDVIENPDFIRVPPPRDPAIQTQLSGTTSYTVSARDGGTIVHGRVRLDFPPRALRKDTEIQVAMDCGDDDDCELFIFDLGPDGLDFRHPVTLTLDLVDTEAEDDAGNMVIAWFNEEMQHWEVIEMLAPPDDDHIRGHLYHFSKYSGVGGYR